MAHQRVVLARLRPRMRGKRQVNSVKETYL
jgi:hypothetical protein